MNKREFIGNLFCSVRLNELKNKIKYAPMDYVLNLYEVHKSCNRHVRFMELQKLFDERLNNEKLS